MMESMGWSEGGGLGREGQGRTRAIQPTKKKDNTGLGSQRSTKWLDACCAYDSILQKLNVAYSQPEAEAKPEPKSESESEPDKATRKAEKKARKEERKRKRATREAGENEEDTEEVSEKKKKKRKAKKEESSEDEPETKSVKKEEDEEKDEEEEEESKVVPVRHLIYAKRLKSKQVGGYSSDNKAEIFASIQRQVRSEQRRQQRYRPEGFTEDTQVDIYNAAMDKQIKGRTGLGVTKKLSKSKRRDAATDSHRLMTIGNYLSQKFVYAGTLDMVHAIKA